jgi:hypothetical protein
LSPVVVVIVLGLILSSGHGGGWRPDSENFVKVKVIPTSRAAITTWGREQVTMERHTGDKAQADHGWTSRI